MQEGEETGEEEYNIEMQNGEKPEKSRTITRRIRTHGDTKRVPKELV